MSVVLIDSHSIDIESFLKGNKSYISLISISIQQLNNCIIDFLCFEKQTFKSSKANNKNISHVAWNVDTKYYTCELTFQYILTKEIDFANVVLQRANENDDKIQESNTKQSERSNENRTIESDAVVLLMDSSNDTSTRILSQWQSFIEHHDPDIKVLIDMCNEDENSVEMTRETAKQWCEDNGAEMIVMKRDLLKESFDSNESDENICECFRLAVFFFCFVFSFACFYSCIVWLSSIERCFRGSFVA